MTHNQNITITELSRELGLSIATISSVLNNRHKERRISEKTVSRVQEAARKIGYMPNISARRLRAYGSAGHPSIIAILSSYQAPLPLISHTIAGLQKVSREKLFQELNYTITVDMFQAGKLSDIPGLLDGSRFNAAIIANTVPEDDEFLKNNPLQIPTVFIGRDIPGNSSVREMADMTGKQAADILFSTQSRNMAVVRASLMTQTTLARLDGFIEDARRLTGKDPVQIVCDGFTEKDGWEATRTYLQENARFDGLYAITDSLAVGAYHAIKQQSMRIPEDVTIIGTGDYSVSPYLDPPLSTFTRSQYNMHEEAARLLLRHLIGAVRTPTQIVVPVLPVLRESTRRGSLAHLSLGT